MSVPRGLGGMVRRDLSPRGLCVRLFRDGFWVDDDDVMMMISWKFVSSAAAVALMPAMFGRHY